MNLHGLVLFILQSFLFQCRLDKVLYITEQANILIYCEISEYVQVIGLLLPTKLHKILCYLLF